MKHFLPLLALLVVVLGLQGVIYLNRPEPLPVLGSVGSFNLVDKNNNEVNSEELKNKIWVAHFFFTSCPKICPLIMNAASQVANKFEKNNQVNIVSISVDSKTDTPEVLTNYSNKNGFVNSNWLLLTGSSKDVRELSYDKFKLGLGEDFSLHSTRMVLIDGSGDIRGYYDSQEQSEIDRLIKDINSILNY